MLPLAFVFPAGEFLLGKGYFGSQEKHAQQIEISSPVLPLTGSLQKEKEGNNFNFINISSIFYVSLPGS